MGKDPKAEFFWNWRRARLGRGRNVPGEGNRCFLQRLGIKVVVLHGMAGERRQKQVRF